MPSSLTTAQQKLAESREQTRILQVAQMQPNQSPETLALLKNLERSSRAETKLRLKALEFERQKAQRAAISPENLGLGTPPDPTSDLQNPKAAS